MVAPAASHEFNGAAHGRPNDDAERASTALQRTIDALSRLAYAEDFIPAVLQIVADVFGAKSCAFCEHPGETIFLRYWWHDGRVLGPTELPNVDAAHLGVIRRLANGFTAPFSHLGVDLHRRSEPSLVDHRRHEGDAELQTFAISMGWDRELNVPIVVAGAAIGGLVIYRSQDAPFDARDVALASSLGKQLALALQVRQLVGRERERVAAIERRVAADQLTAHLTSINATLQLSIDALARSTSPDDLIPAVLRLVGSTYSAKSSAFFEVAPDDMVYGRYWLIEGCLYGPEEILALDADRYATVRELARGFRVPRSYLGARPTEQFETVLVDHAAGTAVPSFDAFGRSVGWELELNVPVVANGKRVAALCIYRAAGQPFSATEVSLAESLAKQLGLALAFARLSERCVEAAAAHERELASQERAAELAEANAILRKAVTRLAEASDPESMVHQALISISEALPPSEVIDVALIEYRAITRRVRVQAILRNGSELPLGDIDFAQREWSVDDAVLARPWKRISEGQFLWGLLSDETVLHPAARPFHEASGAKSIAYQPLVIGSETVGWVAFVLRSEVAPEKPRIALMQMLASQVFLAIEMQRLSEEARAAAVAREREWAVRQQVTELAKVNEALRSSVDALAAAASLEDIHAVFLREAMRVTEADAGAVLLRTPGTSEFVPIAIDTDGQTLLGAAVRDSPLAHEIRDVSRAGGLGHFGNICKGKALWRPIDDAFVAELPLVGAVHVAAGRKELWDVPFAVGGVVVGYLSLVFKFESPLSAVVAEAVTVLATQVGLAIETKRLSEVTREAAVARERQAVAEERVDALARTNAALSAALTKIANEPVSRAPELLLVEVARAAKAAVCYWFEHDAREGTLTVALRVEHGRLLDGPASDEPEIFRAPFAANVTPAFAVLCAEEAFTTICSRSENAMMWPGTLAWHRRHGREEALAFALKVGDEVLGLVGMAFADAGAMDDVPKQQLVRALSNQFALALKLGQLARDAERAAVDRARSAELATANEAMRRAVDRLAREPELESFLGFLLLEVASQLGSDTAAITPFSEADDAFRAGVTLHDGQVTPLGSLHAEVKRSDAKFLDRLQRAEGFALFDVETEPDLFWPGAVEYLKAYAKRYSLSFAIRVDGRLYGQVSLAYTEKPKPSPQQTALVQALCTQAALAIQLTRLAAESRAAETASAIAAERNRMAGEIHDSLAQSFTSIAMQSESLISDLDEHSPLRDTLEIIEETARLGLAEARSSVLALRPIGDVIGELQKTLEQLAERCNIAGTVTCEFRTRTEACALSPDVRDTILRVAQEAVNNALRHASATRLVIEFDVHDGEAILCVHDDGIGIEEAATKQRAGFGLVGMRTRAESLGGTMTVSGRDQSPGTTVRIVVPCHADRATPP